MSKKKPIVAYFDEHIRPSVVNSFREQRIKCLLISKTRKYAGVDEREYIQQIRAEGAFFVTGDAEFVKDVIRQKIKHAGIVLIPTAWEDDLIGYIAAGIAGFVLGFIDREGRRSLYDTIFSIEEDGFHIIVEGIDKLEYSFDRMIIDVDLYRLRGKI